MKFPRNQNSHKKSPQNQEKKHKVHAKMRGKISDPLAIKMNNTTLGSLEGHKHIENQDPVVPSYRVLNPAGFLVK